MYANNKFIPPYPNETFLLDGFFTFKIYLSKEVSSVKGTT